MHKRFKEVLKEALERDKAKPTPIVRTQITISDEIKKFLLLDFNPNAIYHVGDIINISVTKNGEYVKTITIRLTGKQLQEETEGIVNVYWDTPLGKAITNAQEEIVEFTSMNDSYSVTIHDFNNKQSL